MPNYRFRWNAFDDVTVEALAVRLGFREQSGTAREFLARRVARPDDDFVRVTKSDLERGWLPSYAGALEIVRHLRELEIGPGGPDIVEQQDAVRYIAACRNSKRLRALLVEALRRFGDEDRIDDGTLDPLAIKRFARLRPALQPIDTRKPHPHQKDAWKALDAAEQAGRAEGIFAGLLVMPTGSGKTYAAGRVGRSGIGGFSSPMPPRPPTDPDMRN